MTDPYICMPITLGGGCGGEWMPPSRPQMPPANGGSTGSGGSANGNHTGSSTGSGGQEQPDARGFDAMYLGSLPLAMAYTPMQQWKTVYSAEQGLLRGTIFPELDLPFEGRTILSERAKGGRR